MEKKTDKEQKKEHKIMYDSHDNTRTEEKLLDKLKREAEKFRELMSDFNDSCSVKYAPTVVKQVLEEASYYSSDDCYAMKWKHQDYQGAIKDLRYAIACVEYLPAIASVETMHYLITDIKDEETYEAFIKKQVNELENIIDQIHLDWDSSKNKEEGPS